MYKMQAEVYSYTWIPTGLVKNLFKNIELLHIYKSS